MAGDGSFDLSGVIRLNSRDFTAGAQEASNSLDKMATGEKKVADAAGTMASKTNDAKTAAVGLAAAEVNAAKAADALAVAEGKVAAAVGKSATDQRAAAVALASAQVNVAKAALNVEKATQAQSNALKGLGAESNRAAFGARNLGQQVGDFATQVSLGGGVVRAFTSQIGQVGFALSEMDGKLGKVGGFLTGPWGIALTVAALVAAPFVEKLFDAGKASDELEDKLAKAATAADSFGNAQTLIGKIIDTTTGKLKTQNAVLIETIKLQAQAAILAGQRAEQEARKSIGGLGASTFGENFGIATGGFSGTVGGGTIGSAGRQDQAIRDTINSNAPLRRLRSDILGGSLLDASNITKRVDAMVKAGQLAQYSAEQIIGLKEQLLTLPRALNDIAAGKAAEIAANGGPIDPRLVPYSRDKKPKKPKATPSTAARDEFGRDAAAKIAQLRDQFDETAPAVAAVNKQIADLDDLIDDLARRKPPGFEKMIKDAQALKPLVEDSLNKPYKDFIKDQAQAFEVQKLIAAGRVDEASALRVIQQIEATGLVLSQERKDAILASAQAMRGLARETEIARQKAQKYLDAISDVKGTLQDAITGAISGSADGIKDLPKRLLQAFQSLQGKIIFEKIFGSIFRDLEDQVNGVNTVKNASDRMAKALDTTKQPLADLAKAAQSAAAALNGVGAGGSGDGVTVADDGTIEVTAKKKTASIAEIVKGKIDGVLSKISKTLNLKGIMEGAATGAVVASVGSLLGIGGAGTKSQAGGTIGGGIGAAVGSIIPGVGTALGSIIGSIGGTLLGSLIKGKPMLGSTVLTSATAADPGAWGRLGGLENVNAVGGGVQDALKQISTTLGTALGAFSVGIGNVEYNGQSVYRVSGDGRYDVGTQDYYRNGGTTIYDGTDPQAALAAAVRNAIEDGALVGISEAMKKALAQNSDLDTGIAEALKVKEIESLIGGLGSSIKNVFAEFDAAAAERVRIAKAYGLDLVAVEKLNAEQRADLVENTLKERVGSLADFLNSIKYGDLFEGSASERRTALLAEIDKVKVKAQAGETGAADQLQSLLSQLVGTSRDAYGTAGTAYASDRALALTEVQKVIQMETDRIQAASGLTTDQLTAIQAGNSLAEEANQLAAIANARLAAIAAALGTTTGTTVVDTSLTAR